jgi:hypothetical protein
VNDAGYTATEALAALAILGLAVGGLTSGLKVIGQGELATSRKVAETVALRAASDEFAILVRGQGPFRSDDPASLAGDARRLSFPCDGGACEAQLTATGLRLRAPHRADWAIVLSDPVNLRFHYRGSVSEVPAWPPAPPPLPAPQWQVLQAIILERLPGGEAVAVTRIASAQAADCDFDGILQDCRKTGS